jgi:hypothetical protein
LAHKLAHSSVVMPVVNVGIVRMGVHPWLMSMEMGVRLAGRGVWSM